MFFYMSVQIVLVIESTAAGGADKLFAAIRILRAIFFHMPRQGVLV